MVFVLATLCDSAMKTEEGVLEGRPDGCGDVAGIGSLRVGGALELCRRHWYDEGVRLEPQNEAVCPPNGVA